MTTVTLFLGISAHKETRNYTDVGVYFCHSEFKMASAHPVCSSGAFSDTSGYAKHDNPPMF